MRMRSSQNFPTLKLDLIKSFFLINENVLHKDTLAKISAANSVGEILCLLFSCDLFEPYKKLIAEGIFPTSSEMNQCISNTNAWHWLASSDTRIPVFQSLLAQGVIPSAQALAERDTRNNTNA